MSNPFVKWGVIIASIIALTVVFYNVFFKVDDPRIDTPTSPLPTVTDTQHDDPDGEDEHMHGEYNQDLLAGTAVIPDDDTAPMAVDIVFSAPKSKVVITVKNTSSDYLMEYEVTSDGEGSASKEFPAPPDGWGDGLYVITVLNGDDEYSFAVPE